MARVWNASDVSPAGDIEATQYNNLRDDVEAVYKEVVPVGTITMWAGTDANVPTNWLLCDGSTISRATYATLFTALGSGFGGGDGSTTFEIPDMRDRFVVGAGTTYARDGKGGSVSVTLSTAQLASHTHTGPSHRHSVGITSGAADRDHTHTPSVSGSQFMYGFPTSGGNAVSSSSTSFRIGNTTTTSGQSQTHYHSVSGNTGYQGTGSTDSAGSGSSHENRPPYIGLFYIIKALQEE